MRVEIVNWINGKPTRPVVENWIDKVNPATGEQLWKVAASTQEDVHRAVHAAQLGFGRWSLQTPVNRGKILSDIVTAMKERIDILTECVAVETGKSLKDAQGEVGGAILQGEYFAGEGMRLYARSLTSAMPNKYTHCIRMPLGVAALIVPANTPIANIAWKVFPALVCGNTAVLKASEDAPKTAMIFAELCQLAGLPDGVLNVVHGRGDPAGSTLVKDPRVALISFTGSTQVGRWIAEAAGSRLARISLELGGKNPFVVCDDADIDQAVHWASLSAFSNAGQRCSAGSRIIIFDKIYDEFRHKLITKTKSLKLGVSTGCDVGPVISRSHRDFIISAIANAISQGGQLICGGVSVFDDPELNNGFYISPTLFEGIASNAELNRREIFGPVATLQKVSSMEQALDQANDSEYGLTAAIHTRNVDRALWFAHRIRSGVANVNFGTFGSEPHMPFGGFGISGNGTREPGVEALDVYSELKNISFLVKTNFS